MFKHINNELKKYEGNNMYSEMVISKDKTTEYKEWSRFVKKTEMGGCRLLNDTAGQNISFTAFSQIINNFEGVDIVDFCTIQKSMLPNLFSFYIKSTVRVEHSSGYLLYPSTIIVSPETIYSKIFQEAYDKITKEYPSALFVPFSILKDKVKFNIPCFKNQDINYYQALFGYEGDILTSQMIGDSYYSPSVSIF